MELSIKAAMKRINLLEAQKNEILTDEAQTCTTSYVDEVDKLVSGYDYADTRRLVSDIDDEIRTLRVAIHKANCTEVIPGRDMTAGEALVYIAQLNKEKSVLETLARRQPKTRTTTFRSSDVEYTELNYDVLRVRDDLRTRTGEIAEMQLALDEFNLMHKITV